MTHYPTIPAPEQLARDGRSFVQVGRVCVWGRKGESEESLRARKAYQIENA